ncbi:MAG: hypothetical protein RR232_06770 [Clostridia bacterium]
MEEQKPKSDLAEKVSALSPQQWKKWQTWIGIALGLLIGLCLFGLGETKSFGSISFLVAVVIAMFAPRLITRTVARDFRRGQIVMAITLVGCLAIFVVYGLINGTLP